MANEIETITNDGEIVSGLPAGYGEAANVNAPLAIALARAEIDQQIMTARALPRSIDRAISNILNLATLDDETAEECTYALPRGGKPINGPSIRLAEIIAGQWGNCRVGARVVHVDRIEKYVEAEGVFHDLETNVVTTARVKRRLSDKGGRLLSEDMIIVTGNAASSIAKRNAILAGVPKGVWRKAYAHAERVIAGDIKTLSVRREAAVKAFAAFGVLPEQVFAALGVTGISDVGLDHLVTLTGMRSALKSGEATVEELFPRQALPGDKPKGTAAALDKLASARKPAKDAPTRDERPAEDKAPEQPKDAPAAVVEASEPDDGGERGDGEPQAMSPASIARGRGYEARMKGMSRKALPGEYRDAARSVEADAWVDGYNDADAKLAENPAP